MSTTITVKRDVRAELKERAQAFREQMTRQGTLVVNLVSSPGAGKTRLLEAMAVRLRGKASAAVLVGDLATERDAERLRPFLPVEQLTTGGACHLEIPLVETGYGKLSIDSPDLLLIENVGNLVCPASHDLGEHLRVVLLSTTEGDDKPGKYPKMFRTSHALVITKSDLLPYVPFQPSAAIADARRIQPELTCSVTSAERDEGIDDWCTFLLKTLAELRAGQLPPTLR